MRRKSLIGLVIVAAASVAGAGALLGRKFIDRRIEKRLPAEIEIAKATAVAELHKTIAQVISERLAGFLLNLCIKGAAVAALFALFHYGVIDGPAFRISASVLLAAFLIRDALHVFPFIFPALELVRAHGWNGAKAFREFIAGAVFERAYAEALVATQQGPHARWIALSNYSAQSLSEDVAKAVADVARTTDFSDAKRRALLAVAAAGFMAAFYSVYLFIAFHSA
ncbi:MAG: hypothetical protein R3C60_03715 [Parvularculaceae bacterium]